MKQIKVDIYEQGRFYGTLRVQDKWQGIFPINSDELAAEVERRLPTLKRGKYEICFA